MKTLALFLALALQQVNAQMPANGNGVEIRNADFAGGAEQLAQYFSQNLNYPQEAAVRHVEGKVSVVFTIDSAGAVQDAKIRNGLGHGCEEEALRLVQAMPKWNPALLDGKPISSGVTVQVEFRLPR